jgi:hypothetical protein
MTKNERKDGKERVKETDDREQRAHEGTAGRHRQGTWGRKQRSCPKRRKSGSWVRNPLGEIDV